MNSFGTLFRISIFGESHGPAIGITIDGCPPGLKLSGEDFLADLQRRRSGSKGTTPRQEPDLPEMLSGVYNGYTTGAPLTLITRNTDKVSSDYDRFLDLPRPGHADFTARIKSKGYADTRGSGHFSGRITWGLVAAGVLAKKILHPAEISARLISAGGSEDIEAAIELAMQAKDSIGGVVECIARQVPAGLGDPFFNSAESVISHLVFSVPAIKGIEFGSGFAASGMRGSMHNDPITDSTGKTLTNNAGGINGGITNGNELIFRVAVKPTSSIGAEQTTFNFSTNKMDNLKTGGRHDTCIALRMPVIIEAVTAIGLADLLLTDRGISGRTS